MNGKESRPGAAAQDRLGVIFFGEDWGRHNSTGQYLAQELARRCPVLWIDSLGLRTPRFTLADFARIGAKIRRFFHGARVQPAPNAKETVTVLTPLVIPYHRSRVVRLLNRMILSHLVGQARRKLGLERVVIITACPASADMVAHLRAEASVYYCADEYAELAGMDGELTRKLEGELLRHVDLVVATAKRLAERKAALHPWVHYLPHGVDYDHFSRAARDALPCPDDLCDIGTPRIGFVGLLGEHIDFALIKHLARELPAANVVLIGPKEDGIALPRGTNLHYLGPRPYARLPAYLAHFDVCVLPYADSERNRNANPVKLREYLAAGCPVIATPVAEAAPLAPLFLTANSPDAFVAAVRSALQTTNRRERTVRSATMANSTWSHRAAELWGLIDEILREREGAALSRTTFQQQEAERVR